ncbi:MAG: hypothetical protein WA906_11625, partial [Pacificimonas sp.]
LMQEPDLEEDRFDVAARGDRLAITTRGERATDVVDIEHADGSTQRVRPDANTTDAEGLIVTMADVPGNGLARVRQGSKSRFALVGNMAELSDVRPRAAPFDQLADDSGGGTFWLDDGVPDVRAVDIGARRSGSDWLGVTRRDGGALLAAESEPAVHPGILLTLAVGFFLFGWWRERG